jgi:hypothetical protein
MALTISAFVFDYSTWYYCAAIPNNIEIHLSRTFGNDLHGTVNSCTAANSPVTSTGNRTLGES